MIKRSPRLFGVATPNRSPILTVDASGSVDDRRAVHGDSRLPAGSVRTALAYLGAGGGGSRRSAGAVLPEAVCLSSGSRSCSVICSRCTATPK